MLVHTNITGKEQCSGVMVQASQLTMIRRTLSLISDISLNLKSTSSFRYSSVESLQK